MAKDIEKVIDLLNDMQKTNVSNANNFDRLLVGINSKLDLSSSNKETELLTNFLNELAKTFDEQYSDTLGKIRDIEKAIKAVYDTQDSHVKNSDMKELFDILSKNINNFYTEARQEKAILASIESKIGDFTSNKTDKEDILRTISLLRNDLSNINLAYKNTIDDINSTLKSILAGIKNVDPVKTGEVIKTQLDIMFKSVNDIVLKLHEIEEKEEHLESIIENVVTNEDFKYSMGIIDSIIAKTNEIEEKLNLNAQKDDIDDLHLAISNIDNKTDSAVTKEDFSLINEQTASMFKQTEEIKQILSKVAQNIENVPDSEELESNLKKLYSHIYDIAESIKSSDVKSCVSDLNEKFELFKDELMLIKNIITDFNDTVALKILENIDTLSFNTTNLQKYIAAISEKFPSKDEIENILENNIELNTLLEKSKNIEDGIASIYDKTLSIENSFSEFAKNNSGLDVNYFVSELDKIKSIIESKAEKMDKAYNFEADPLKEYLSQVKTLLQDNPKNALYSKVMDIEDSIVNNQTFNESAFSQIIDKINFIENMCSVKEGNSQIEEAVSELSSLKKTISDLVAIFDDKKSEISGNSVDVYTLKSEEFISQKLKELKDDLAQIVNEATDKITNGFVYRTELLDQKTAAVQELLSEPELPDGLDNPEFVNKLTKADEILESFRQELQLVSTDITENISGKAADILNELEPIKKLLSQIAENSNSEVLKGRIDSLNEDLSSNSELIDLSSDFAELYDKLNSQISDNENNLKDFILTETDSLIIKFENLKEYVEQSVSSIIPPDPKQMKELIAFLSDLDNFKKEQAALLNRSVEEIKNEVKVQSEEIKSMLTVVSNHTDIIEAIEALKKSFKSKSVKKTKSHSDEGVETEGNYYSEEAIEDLKSDFEKYSRQIEQLSGENSQIINVLKNISDKLENVAKTAVISPEQDEISDSDLTDDYEVSEDDIFGDDKFDFVQAFEMLQNDIKSLNDKVEDTCSIIEKENWILGAQDNAVGISPKLDSVLKTYNNTWLSDIKDYIKTNNNNLSLKLDSIGSKLDVFVSDTANIDLLNEISETINDINDNIAEISPKMDVIEPQIQVITPKVEKVDRKIDGLLYQIDDLSPKIDDIAPKIEGVIGPEIDGLAYKIDELTPQIEEKLSESDQKLSSMLETLNNKIIELSSKNSSLDEFNDIKSLISEQKQYIKDLEPSEKLEAFKKCLEEMSFEVNALATDSNADSKKLEDTIKEMKESLMSAVVHIFGQVSFIEESEDIKDFVEERTSEINQRISEITKQLQELNEQNGDGDYSYTMQDIETDLTKLRVALQKSGSIDLSDVSEKLHMITSSVDSLTQEEMKELKTEITNLKNQTEFLAATSDKYYNAINIGMEGFEEALHSNVSGKIDMLSKKLENAAESDKVIKQALIYMGEWIDSASESINKISANSDEIVRINDVIDGIGKIKSSVNEQIDNIIDEKFELLNIQFKTLEKQLVKVDKLEAQFAKQQERIDRLELNIDKLLNMVENLDDPGVTRKIDKIERQISKLGNNIEKLASYVD